MSDVSLPLAFDQLGGDKKPVLEKDIMKKWPLNVEEPCLLAKDIDCCMDDCILKIKADEEEKKILKKCEHSKLLYDYRCQVIHEYEDPYFSIEEMSGHDEKDEMFYINLDSSDEPNYLIYTIPFLLKLTNALKENIHSYFNENDINVIDRRKFLYNE